MGKRQLIDSRWRQTIPPQNEIDVVAKGPARCFIVKPYSTSLTKIISGSGDFPYLPGRNQLCVGWRVEVRIELEGMIQDGGRAVEIEIRVLAQVDGRGLVTRRHQLDA